MSTVQTKLRILQNSYFDAGPSSPFTSFFDDIDSLGYLQAEGSQAAAGQLTYTWAHHNYDLLNNPSRNRDVVVNYFRR